MEQHYVEQSYIEQQYHLAVLDFKTAHNEDEQWEARKNLARIEQLAAQVYGFRFADKLRDRENL